jgi:prepilin signal peptidase PulO-like enzyme (type II secretory pathway)
VSPAAPPVLPIAVSTAILFGALATRVHPGLVLAAAWWLAACAVPLAFIDAAVRRLPDRLTIPAYAGTAALLLSAAAVSGHWPILLRAALGGLALAGFYLALLLISPSAMGLGDVKLAASLGTLLAWFGWRTLIAGGFAGFGLAGTPGVASRHQKAAHPLRPLHGPGRLPGDPSLALSLRTLPPRTCARLALTRLTPVG